jgi:Sec-independent protein translocase protein TatA
MGDELVGVLVVVVVIILVLVGSGMLSELYHEEGSGDGSIAGARDGTEGNSEEGSLLSSVLVSTGI